MSIIKNFIKLLFAFSFIFTLRTMEKNPAYDVIALKKDADLFFKIVTDQQSVISAHIKLQKSSDNLLTEALEQCQTIISTIQQSKQKQPFINLLAPTLHFYEFFPRYYELYLKFVEYLKDNDVPQEAVNQAELNLNDLARINEAIQNIRESSKN